VKLSNELNESINEQILCEYHNALVYAQIQSYFEGLQLKKIAEYFKKQSIQETEHAQKFIQHLNDRAGGKVTICEISPPILDLSSVESIGRIYILTEEGTTESIESIYELASDTKSFIDLPFLLDMLSEQVEEENSSVEFALKLKNTKDLVLFDALGFGV
jgi:ferritin